MLITWTFIISGLVLLTLSSEWIVRGSSQLSLRLGIHPLVVGLTVVAFGTSAPELVASLHAHLVNHAGNIAVGNVIGSNIINIGGVLGLSALLLPLKPHTDILKREAPLVLVAVLLLFLFMTDQVFSQWEGGLFLGLFFGYLALQYYIVRVSRGRKGLEKEFGQELKMDTSMSLRKTILLIVVGLAGLPLGAKFFIDGAIEIARQFGWSERLIGLTIVAIGTSLPELATSLMAAYKKEADIAIANVIGSNLFNILLIIGVAASFNPITFEKIFFSFDTPVMVAMTILLWGLLLTRRKLERWGGALLFVVYGIYTIFLFHA